jgi:hypothetical protein
MKHNNEKTKKALGKHPTAFLFKKLKYGGGFIDDKGNHQKSALSVPYTCLIQ